MNKKLKIIILILYFLNGFKMKISIKKSRMKQKINSQYCHNTKANFQKKIKNIYFKFLIIIYNRLTILNKNCQKVLILNNYPEWKNQNLN